MGGFVNVFGECGLSVGSVLQSGPYKSFEMWWPGRELNMVPNLLAIGVNRKKDFD